MDPAERMRRNSMESQKQLEKLAASNVEQIKKDTERNLEIAKHQQELAQQNFKPRRPTAKTGAGEYDREDQSTISRILSYIFFLIVIGFILWVLYNIVLNSYMYGFFG